MDRTHALPSPPTPCVLSRPHPMSPLFKLPLALVATSLMWAPFPASGQQSAKSPSAMTDNPLLTESPLPFQFPAFDKIRNEHFGPAFEVAMAAQLKEIEAIARDPAQPTFE